MDRPRSVSPDNLRKIKMQCQRSDMVMFWPKSHIMSPSSQWQQGRYVAENVISVTIGWKFFDLWLQVIAPWFDLIRSFFPKIFIKGCSISSAKFQRDPPSVSAVTSENLMGGRLPLPCADEGYVSVWLKIRLSFFLLLDDISVTVQVVFFFENFFRTITW